MSRFRTSIGLTLFVLSSPLAGLSSNFSLHIQPRNSGLTQLLLSWPSRVGKVYTVGSSNNLSNGFTGSSSNVQATPPRNTWWVDRDIADQPQFFRISEDDPGSFNGPRAPAYRLNARMGAGNNFMAAKSMNGNGAPEDYALLNASRFQHCRIGYKMDEVAGGAPDHILPADRLAALQDMVDWCLAEGLIAIVDPVHNWANNNDPAQEYEDTPENRLKLHRIWEQVAVHFSGYEVDNVVFEIMNEPHGEDDVSTIIQIGLGAIRSTSGNEERIVIVSGDGFSTRQAFIDALDNDEIPSDDPFLIGTFHYYDPRPFTKQAANPDLNWGTGAELAAVEAAFDEVAAANQAWASRNNTNPLPVYLGEFGVDNEADNWNDDREKWLSWIRMQAEARGFSWAHWSMYNNSDSAKGMGPWTAAERNDPSLRTFDAAPLEALIGHYEFEQGSTSGGAAIAEDNPGYSGSGYTAFPELTGLEVWARADGIYIPADGTYRVQIHYASDLDRTVRLVTGAQVLDGVLFPSTGGLDSWATLSLVIDFNASTASGLDEESLKIVASPDPGPQLDWVHVSAPAVPAVSSLSTTTSIQLAKPKNEKKYR